MTLWAEAADVPPSGEQTGDESTASDSESSHVTTNMNRGPTIHGHHVPLGINASEGRRTDAGAGTESMMALTLSPIAVRTETLADDTGT